MKFRIAEIDVPASEPFKFDALEREPVVKFLHDLIKQIEGPFVLALDSPWGTGKTTVVRMLRCSLLNDGFECVYFNAWKDDYVTDPLIPMVSAIDELKPVDGAINKGFRGSMAVLKKVAGPIAKRALKVAIKVGTHGVLDVDEATELATADAASDATGDLIDAFQKDKASLQQFRDELEKAVSRLSDKDPSRPLIFFIDELDRCRPSYAIELLESVKHLFDVPNIVFVLSIDKKQLEAITAAVYGERIDAPEYLRRFIDLEYVLPKLHTKKYIRELIKRFEFVSFFDDRKKNTTLAYEHEGFVEAFTLLAVMFVTGHPCTAGLQPAGFADLHGRPNTCSHPFAPNKTTQHNSRRANHALRHEKNYEGDVCSPRGQAHNAVASAWSGEVRAKLINLYPAGRSVTQLSRRLAWCLPPVAQPATA